ncbi:MAG: DMT family transporter [Pseudomonadota bacterium]
MNTGIDQSNLRGIVAMMAALFGFVVNDAIVKLVAEAIPLGQIIFLRGLILATVLSLVISLRREWPPLGDWTHRSVVLRNIGEIGITFFYLTALTGLAVANAVSILQALPFVITAAAALLLGERVGWRRWTAILAGFVGVLIIVRPGMGDFNAYSLFAVIAVGFLTLRDLATRSIPKGISTLSITFSTTLCVTAMAIALGWFETWSMPDWRQLGMIGAASAFLMIGYFFIIIAMRSGDVSAIAPFRYTIILWALLIDLVVWSVVPPPLTMVGIAIIVASGLYMVFRERALS